MEKSDRLFDLVQRLDDRAYAFIVHGRKEQLAAVRRMWGLGEWEVLFVVERASRFLLFYYTPHSLCQVPLESLYRTKF